MTVLMVAPLLLTLTLLVSGLAKLGARQGTVDAMTSLRLPLRSLHPTIASVLPMAEIVLALLLWVPLVTLQTALAVVAALLMVAYLVIIGRALRFDEQVECSCFGTLASPTVSRLTLGRNLLLTALGLVTVAVAARGAMTTMLVQSPLTLIGLGAAVLATIALTAFTLGDAGTGAGATEAAGAAGAAGAATDGPHDRRTTGAGADDPHGQAAEAEDEAEDEELLDYERLAIPPAVLQKPDGRLITLTQLSAQRAALVIFVSEGCGPCERVLDQAPGWVEALSPFMQVRFAFSRPVDQLRERTTQRVGELAMHDLQFTARSTLGGRTAPSAVLLGADGLLAGGPVDGGTTVIGFVEDIRTQLADAQEQGELPTPTT